jgi:hypothetical protein
MAWFKRKEKGLQLLKTKWMFQRLWYKSPTEKL